ncbi:MAG: universal stress protein [Salinigranum sp.]
MTTFALGTTDFNVSAVLCDYLQNRLSPDDVVHAVNVLPGDADEEAVRDGADALNVVQSRLGAFATVETVQSEGGDPAAAILDRAAEVGADELVVGRRPESAVTGAVLAEADRPVVVVPLPPA